MADKKSFVMYCDYKKHFSLLSPEDQGHLLMAIFDYVESGAEPQLEATPLMAFSFIQAQLDRDIEKYAETCRKRREAGKQGGRPPKPKGNEENQTEAKKANGFSKNQTEAKKPDNDNGNENENDNDNDNGNENENDVSYHDSLDDSQDKSLPPPEQIPPPEPEKPEKPIKHKYGEYNNVLLTDEELDKLKSEYPDWEDRIERLSSYIASKGTKYKSHYATIRNWARKDAEARRVNTQRPAQQPRPYSNPALEYVRELERRAQHDGN